MNLIEMIARQCHYANKFYCETIGDMSQPDWEGAPLWQRESAIKGVEFHLDNPGASHSASHDSWMAEKTATGWKYGEIKDAVKKTHPCYVAYDELPEEQKAKDRIFKSIVDANRFLFNK